MAAIPGDLQQPLKKMQELQVGSGMIEQLNGIILYLPSGERLANSIISYIISTWAHLQPITLPPPLQSVSQMTPQHDRIDLT